MTILDEPLLPEDAAACDLKVKKQKHGGLA